MSNNTTKAALCEMLVSGKDQFGFHAGYYKCDRPVKFRISVKGVRGEIETYDVCGVHANAAKKKSERVKKRMNYDDKLTITPPPAGYAPG